MKILVAAPRPLFPVETGLELRVYNLLKPLCSKHEISLVCFAPADGPSGINAELKTHFKRIELVQPDVRGRSRSGPLGRIREWFSPSDVPLGDLSASLNMKEKVRTLAESGQFDLALIASPFMVNYFLAINNLAIVFDAIDDTSLLFRRDIGLAGSFPAKARAIKDWLIIGKVERKFYGRFKEIVLSSPIDAQIMKKLCPKSTITVIGNGVDAAYFDSNYSEPERPTLIFSGVMNYGPNILAAKYFCNSIFPLILKRIPEANLLIVGRNPAEEVMALGKNQRGVEITGEVADIRPYIGRANIYVCPLISGAGIKNKILEAWASSRAVVATSLSCEGIDVTPEDDVLVADEPVAFAEAVIKLLGDSRLRRDLAAKGRNKALRLYNWELKAMELEKVFWRAADK